MKKPFVHTYMAGDLYVAPSAIELPKEQQPGLLSLNRGETGTIDKYSITFEKFELPAARRGYHGRGSSLDGHI